MAYQDYWKELAGAIPKLPIPLAQRLVNKAWAEIRDMRTWSWLTQTSTLYTPPAVTTGTVSVTRNSPLITFNAGAAAALNASIPLWPIFGDIGLGRQVRIGSSPNFGQIYTITAWASPVATLDRNYSGDTNLAAPYIVYRCYYSTPVVGFVRYLSATNPGSGYSITGRALQLGQDRLDRIDPQRGSLGDPYYFSPWKKNATGTLVHELWPHPQTDATLYICYQSRGTDLSNTVDVPPSFPADLLLLRAYLHAYDWAHTNIALYPELQLTNWVQARSQKEKHFYDRLIQVIKQDDEQVPQLPFRTGRVIQDLPGGSWLQSHALPLGGNFG